MQFFKILLLQWFHKKKRIFLAIRIAWRRILNDWKFGCLPSLLILASQCILLVFVIWQLSRWVLTNLGKQSVFELTEFSFKNESAQMVLDTRHADRFELAVQCHYLLATLFDHRSAIGKLKRTKKKFAAKFEISKQLWSTLVYRFSSNCFTYQLVSLKFSVFLSNQL